MHFYHIVIPTEVEESRQILTRTGSFDFAQDDIKKCMWVSKKTRMHFTWGMVFHR
jgi:hypothetical protein